GSSAAGPWSAAGRPDGAPRTPGAPPRRSRRPRSQARSARQACAGRPDRESGPSALAAPPLEVAREEVRGGARVRALTGAGEPGREALVERLHGHVDGLPKQTDEAFRLGRLLAAGAAQRQGQTDDDPLRGLVADELPQTCE